jgi:DNA polymerase-2
MKRLTEHRGWLLDIYAHPQDGIVLWFLEGKTGSRLRLWQPFSVTFYVAGSVARLRELWRFLRAQRESLVLSRTQRRDLFQQKPIDVLAVQVERPIIQPFLFRRVSRAFPDLTYYDADLPLNLRYAAVFGTFPLAYCQVIADEDGCLQKIDVLDSPWDLDPLEPPLRILSLEPDVDPAHAPPKQLNVRTSRGIISRLRLETERPLLVNLNAILRQHDPDLLFTKWGDTWLLPLLLDLSQRHHIPLLLNRDPGMGVSRRAERSYFTYGQIIHRGQQIHLFGRAHIDIFNAMLFHDYELDGVMELARVTSLPLQTVARVSPGSGISAMQMLTALREGILVPWHKQQAEYLKSALELLHADQGGMVYQPLIGLHRDVAEIDFISMYPSVMVYFNISPETVNMAGVESELVPELGVHVARERTGLVPQTLKPLLDKRVQIKNALMNMPSWDPRRRKYKARASAHKWLLVTCFGYLGYKNARFGRIEAHESVTAYGREALLRAKEAAEDLGFTVLHMYVDGLWVQKKGAKRMTDFQPLLDEIAGRTGLPIALDGIYKWLAFLPSKVDPRLPVPNRYFGAFQDGSLKVRGIELRRRDTPLFIIHVQKEMLKLMAEVPDADRLQDCLPEMIGRLRKYLADLRAYRVPLEQLLVAQKLSRALSEYRVYSPAAYAAAQLEAVGKSLRPGQMVRFLYTLGKPGVTAWDLPVRPDVKTLDNPRYAELLLRAAASVLQPLGVEKTILQRWLFGECGYTGLGENYLFPINRFAPRIDRLGIYDDVVGAMGIS